MKRSNLKNCSFESKIIPGTYLNFDEEGLVNIFSGVKDGIPQAIMSLKQWNNLYNLIDDKEKTLEERMFEHFEAEFENDSTKN